MDGINQSIKASCEKHMVPKASRVLRLCLRQKNIAIGLVQRVNSEDLM